MTEGNEQGGFGAKIKINISDTMTVIAKLLEFDPIELEKILADWTGHDSPGGYEEKIATGKRKVNPFTCTLGWDRSKPTHDAIQAAFDSDDTVTMSVEDRLGAEVIEFEVHIQKIGRIYEQEEGFRAEVNIEPTGMPEIVEGS